MAITYCIVCNITGEKYYGSTKSTLSIRMNHHRCDLNCSSKKILLRDDYVVYTLGEYETIEEARLKEDWYICNNECINERRVTLTDEERKEYHIKQCKKYREKNKEQISEYKKMYYQKNKEQISENDKQYYQKNKEQINEKNKEKVECEYCKSIVRRGNITRHQKTKRCKQFQ